MRVVALAALLLISPVALARAGASSRPLLYTTAAVSGTDVYVDGVAGGNALSLTGGNAQATDPQWSPDGTRVAFVSQRSDTPGVLVAAADGSGLTRLTTGPASQPSWSPDGKQIAFLVNTSATHSVETVDVATKAVSVLTATGGQKIALAWSPAGKQLLYVDQSSGGPQVTTLDVATGATEALAAGLQPVWSPDGTRIAYDDGSGKVAVMAANGAGQHELTTLFSQAPAWSPDGKTVVFTASYQETTLPSNRYGYPTRTDLYAAPADGSTAARRITGPFDQLDISGHWPTVPSFSPDGGRLFYRVGAAVWSANADGTCEEPWPGIPAVLQGPLWQPGTFVGGTACVDLRTRGTADPYTAAINQPVQVRIAIENHGNLPATGVVLHMPPSPPGVQVAGCIDPCPVGTIPAGATATVSVTVASASPGNAVVRFSATADQPDPTPDDAAGVTGATVPNCTQVGTWGSDRLYGTPENDRICGLPGADWISGGKGDDFLSGGSGNDTIFGGPGHDTIIGGGGRDTIFARDGQRDYINCGTEYDVAVVDKIDHVTACERVLRK